MADWTVVADLGTAVGTLVLAAATFASVRSANRSARAAERSTMESMRPLILPSRLDDRPEKVGFRDGHWLKVPGGHAVVDVTDQAIYLAISLRNVGRGLAVLNAWQLLPERPVGVVEQPDPDGFRRLTLDLYVPPGGPGFMEGALRDPDEPIFAQTTDAIDQRRDALTVDVLYGDGEGGQRMITRLLLSRTDDDEWIVSVVHHWNLDRADPR